MPPHKKASAFAGRRLHPTLLIPPPLRKGPVLLGLASLLCRGVGLLNLGHLQEPLLQCIIRRRTPKGQ